MGYGLSDEQLADAIETLLGDRAVEVFLDEDVTEIYVNDDGMLRSTRYSTGRTLEEGIRLGAVQRQQFLNAIATQVGFELTQKSPALQAEMPRARFRGARLQGEVAPLVQEPCFNIRKPPSRIIPLDEYVEKGILSPVGREILRGAVRDRLNIGLVGGTGTGKTTLAAAVIHEMWQQNPMERFAILEDTVELIYQATDVWAARTPDDWSLAQLVKISLRKSPDRIIVGEVRDGSALHLLDALSTGHPGGLFTVHANDPMGALMRLDRLAQRENVPPQRELVADAVDLIVMIENRNQRRRVRELARVDGLDERGTFRITPLLPALAA